MRARGLLIFLAACGGEPTRTPVTAPTANGPATPEPTAAVEATAPVTPVSTSRLPALPPSLRCEGGSLGTPIPHPAASHAVPPVAGQMTETAAQAKRLFDSEKWEEALKAHASVINGASHDDDGNRQLAEYHRAIILYRMKRSKESYAAFAAIAKDASHIKHNESLLWVAKILMTEPEHIQLADVAAYTASDVARFDNANQQDVHAVLLYLLGRERAQEGATAEARTLLGGVPPGHPYASAAQQCLALLH